MRCGIESFPNRIERDKHFLQKHLTDDQEMAVPTAESETENSFASNIFLNSAILAAELALDISPSTSTQKDLDGQMRSESSITFSSKVPFQKPVAHLHEYQLYCSILLTVRTFLLYVDTTHRADQTWHFWSSISDDTYS